MRDNHLRFTTEERILNEKCIKWLSDPEIRLEIIFDASKKIKTEKVIPSFDKHIEGLC